MRKGSGKRAQNLRDSGLEVSLYLRSETSPSFAAATRAGFLPKLIANLTEDLNVASSPLIAFLCPDDQIAKVYYEHCIGVEKHASFVLAHGFAFYSGELDRLNPKHRFLLFAPKAIGPKIRENYLKSRETGKPHTLAAAVTAVDASEVQLLARAMGFAESNLIPATFEQEAVGDLISEQNLLCGGLFTLLELTIENMKKAGVPEALIREECLTELELISGLLREKGFEATFRKISQNAQAGAVLQRESLLRHGLRESLSELVGGIMDKSFVGALSSAKLAQEKEKFLVKLASKEVSL